MSVVNKDKICLYRIIHVDNLEHVLKNGICNQHHRKADPNYKNIGDTGLISSRSDYAVKIVPPGGTLGQYVPFYFGPLSPMLYQIKTGYGLVKRVPQEDILYIVCKLTTIIDCCKIWCFTNGHAKDRLTGYYNDVEDLDEVDWKMVDEKYWRNNDEDFDRQRRKQAEFLVKNHVPIECIIGIGTYNDKAKTRAENLVKKHAPKIKVKVTPQFYY